MRTLLRVTADINAANRAVTEGTLPLVVKQTMNKLKPEASYFFSDNGQRSMLMVFDLKDPTQIPAIAEPLFLTLNAKVEFIPVMNAEELETGLKAAMKEQYESVQ